MSHIFTDSNFQSDVLKSDKPVLVDFWAPWCGPCRLMAPVIDEVAAELDGQVTIGKLNVDENSQTAEMFNIMSIPTMLVFKNGQVVDQFVGVVEKDVLKERLEAKI